jgi:hypothetical protein
VFRGYTEYKFLFRDFFIRENTTQLLLKHHSTNSVQMVFNLNVPGVTILVGATLGRCVKIGSTIDDFNSGRFDNDGH